MNKVFWHESDNFGDSITPYILKKIGVEFEYSRPGTEENFIMCGSILPACNENSIIWGSGIAQMHEDIVWTNPKQILAVRGKYTRQICLAKGFDCPAVYGDPGQILPYLFYPNIEHKARVGYVYHMADNVKGDIDIKLPVEEFITKMLEYEEIRTSSLHAYIVAESYGLKVKMIPSINVIGQELKFRDYQETPYSIPEFIKVFPFKNQYYDYRKTL